jgi:hypothetical protein
MGERFEDVCSDLRDGRGAGASTANKVVATFRIQVLLGKILVHEKWHRHPEAIKDSLYFETTNAEAVRLLEKRRERPYHQKRLANRDHHKNVRSMQDACLRSLTDGVNSTEG